VGKEEEVRLFESLKNSKESSDQQGVLTEEEDQRHILIIGGIKVFLPSNLSRRPVHMLKVQRRDNQPRLSWRRRSRHWHIPRRWKKKRSIQIICSLSGRRR
jgi:hypothetical protein